LTHPHNVSTNEEEERHFILKSSIAEESSEGVQNRSKLNFDQFYAGIQNRHESDWSYFQDDLEDEAGFYESADDENCLIEAF